MKHYSDMCEVKLLQKYIKIDTSAPDGIEPAVEFWREQASAAGLKFRVYSPAGLPIPVLTWEGADPALPAIMLNSHMDVVPAVPEDWTYHPYSGHMDDKGDIFGRGTQDTKAVSLQYFLAVWKIKKSNIILKRTVHITLMPDEEIGSDCGMKAFRDSEEFKSLNVGFSLDEGLAAPRDTYTAIYYDKRPWQMKINFLGEAGHGSSMPENTAMEKFKKMVDRLMDFREEQKKLVKTARDVGDYTSVNINQVSGGYLTNVIPSEMSLIVDMRLASTVDHVAFKEKFDSWIAESGSGTTYEFIRREDTSVATLVDDTNPYWVAIQDAAKEMNIEIIPRQSPATSDRLYVRERGIPALGFTPLIKTQTRIHGVDEYVNAEIFIGGIDVYVALIKKLANVK